MAPVKLFRSYAFVFSIVNFFTRPCTPKADYPVRFHQPLLASRSLINDRLSIRQPAFDFFGQEIGGAKAMSRFHGQLLAIFLLPRRRCG